MATRLAVCKILTGGPLATRSALLDVLDPDTGMQAFESRSVIAVDPETGQPVREWCLTVARGTRWGLLDGNPDIDLLPDYPRDAKLSAMHTATRSQMAQRLRARGISTAVFSVADGFRDVIHELGVTHEPAFSVDEFEFSE